MRRLCGVAAIGLAGGVLALGPAMLRAQQPVARGTVAGMVRDSSGAGIAGAEVTIVGTGLRAHTNARGEFRLTNVPAGTVTVGVRRLGFVPFGPLVGAGDALFQPMALSLEAFADRVAWAVPGDWM